MQSSNEGAQPAGAVPGPQQSSEKRCENPDCNVNRLIAMVPKRKIGQFVSDPVVLPKPMLVNGFTAVFQVDGTSAKLMDIKNSDQGEPTPTKPIYRIVPNSHVHVINYVVVDTDESYLKKISDNDPATMQKLQASQKDSADQMLRKIMSGQNSVAASATTTLVSSINNVGPAISKPPDNSLSLPKPVGGINVQPNASTNPSPSSTASGISKGSVKAPIKLPVRMHPNLKITAVASAETVNSAPPMAIAAPPTNPPIIQPVPLANLQSHAPTPTPPPVSPSVPQSSSTTISLKSASLAPVQEEKPTYDKMQQEINDLRRTVAMLAEAQAKNKKPTGPLATSTPAAGPRAAKRPRSAVQK